MSSGASLLEAVAEVAAFAGAAALRNFRPGIRVELKADGSPVTKADRMAEQVARMWIAEHFPNDAIVGEEFGAVERTPARTWWIDPVDGTKSFVKGVPLWGTLISVVEEGQVLAGAAEFPAADERIAAARGEGAWWNGARCAVSTVGSLEQATVLGTDAAFPRDPERGARWRSLADRAGDARTWGDAYGYLLVATGRAEIMVDARLQPWDAAPVQVIVEEAGGVFSDWRGIRTHEGTHGAIATNAALAKLARGILVDLG